MTILFIHFNRTDLFMQYIDKKIQKESAAMETSTITFVTNGRKRETFRGAATVKYMHLEGIEQFDGIMSKFIKILYNFEFYTKPS